MFMSTENELFLSPALFNLWLVTVRFITPIEFLTRFYNLDRTLSLYNRSRDHPLP